MVLTMLITLVLRHIIYPVAVFSKARPTVRMENVRIVAVEQARVVEMGEMEEVTTSSSRILRSGMIYRLTSGMKMTICGRLKCWPTSSGIK